MHGFRFFVVMSALACACGGDSKANGDTDRDTDASTGDRDTDGMTGANMTMTTTATTATTSTTTPPGVDSTGDDDPDDTAGFITDTNEDGPPVDPQPNGSMCSSGEECQSGFCYELPMLGGVCSECINDVDCRTGTCSIDANVLYAVCTDGQVGVMCDSDRGCMEGLVCEPLVDTGGLIRANFCSECGADLECPQGEICTPVYDLAMFQGYHACATPGSVADGGGCPYANGQGNGDVCNSGNCAPADVFGFIEIGICGECDANDDCVAPQTCQPAMVDMTGITPSACG